MKLTQERIRELVRDSKNHRCEPASCCVQLVAIAELPSRFGEFQVCGLQTAGAKLDILGQFYCGLYIDQYDIDL